MRKTSQQSRTDKPLRTDAESPADSQTDKAIIHEPRKTKLELLKGNDRSKEDKRKQING